MNKRVLNIAVSIIVAALFIWLAIRTIDLSDLWQQMQQVTFYWLPAFFIIIVISHYLRAERWRLLLKMRERDIPRSTLFAGVMTGYFVNIFLPRVGEISRPVYVARKMKLNSGNLIGTIVIERFVDVCSMLLLAAAAAVVLTHEFGMLEAMFGLDHLSRAVYLLIPAVLIACLLLFWAIYKALLLLESKKIIENQLLLKLIAALRSFTEGVNSLRNVNNWPVFILLTAGIWTGYILMAYFPFAMLNLGELYSLGLNEAVVLTIVSSVGVSIPTPAGIGSYHLLIQQSMWLLYDVPLGTGLTYATVVHAVTIISVLAITPVTLWWDKYHTLTRG